MKILQFVSISMAASSVLVGSACQIPERQSEFNPAEFIHFLAKHYYLDGGRKVVNKKDKKHIIEVMNCLQKQGGILGNPYTSSFAPNVALVAAQVGLFDIATSVLIKSYKYGEPDWLFDMIKSERKKVDKESILETLKT